MSDAAKPADPSKPPMRECCQDRTLLRDLALINARVAREQGIAAKTGQRAQPRRKPDLPRRESSAPADASAASMQGVDSIPR